MVHKFASSMKNTMFDGTNNANDPITDSGGLDSLLKFTSVNINQMQTMLLTLITKW